MKRFRTWKLISHCALKILKDHRVFVNSQRRMGSETEKRRNPAKPMVYKEGENEMKTIEKQLEKHL